MRQKKEYEGSFLTSARFAQAVVLLLGTAMTYSIQINLSIAIVPMIDNSSNKNFPSYDWDEKIKSLILSSYFWGYSVLSIPGGLMAQKYGGKIMLLLGVSISAVATILTPYCAHIAGWKGVCIFRTCEGLVQACIFPSLHTLLSKWSPPSERGTMATITYLNSQIGTILTMAASGEITASSWGWPGIFYATGGLSLLWCLLYFVVGADAPADSKLISDAEREYIEQSINSSQAENCGKPLKTPWKSIMTSVPFLVLATAHVCFNMGYWTLLTEIPSYLKHVLNMDVKQNGLVSALPYVALWVLGIIFTCLSSLIHKNGWMSITSSRKFFNTIAFWLPAITLICLGYCTKEQTTLAVVLLTISVGLSAAVSFGFQVNHMDLSPNFAGTLLGLTQCPSHVIAIIAPILTGYIITDETNPEQWRIIFYISSSFWIFGNALFIWLGTSEVQPWNDADNENYKAVPLTDIHSIEPKFLQNPSVDVECEKL